MLILPQTIKMSWTARSKKTYVEKGYVFTKFGDIFDVNVLDLPDKSNKKVLVQCDYCSKEYPMAYSDYNERIYVDGAAKIACKNCSLEKAIDKFTGVTEQECIHCGIVKPIDEFRKVKTGCPGGVCKECIREQHRNRAEAREVQMTGKQVCVRCNKEKDILEFNVIKSFSNGRNTVCSDCSAHAKRERRKIHRSNLNIYFFNDRAFSLNFVSVKRGAEGKVTGEELQNIFNQQEGICFYCKGNLTAENVQFDHKLPMSKGGKHVPENICACCFGCNRLKLDRTPDEFTTFLKDYVNRILLKWGEENEQNLS